MSGDAKELEEHDALHREVAALRLRVAELQRAAARHEETEGVSLAEREELLREAERVAHLGTWTWDRGSGRVTWSDELYRIVGLEPGSITPSVEAFFAAIHPDDRARAQEEMDRSLREGVLPLVDCRVVRADGSVRHTTHSSSMLFDAEGVPRRIVGGVLDRTESLETEAKLRGALGLLEEAQRLVHLGSWRYDPRTGELEWSHEFRRILGVGPDTRPSHRTFMERVLPDDRPALEAATKAWLALGPIGDVDLRLRLPDGEARHVRLTGFAVTTASGHPELRGTMLDVTDEVRLREELAHAQKMEAVGRLAGGIAHDFNNLLTVIVANLELLQRRVGSTRELDDSMQALGSAATLTRRLLAFGRKAPLSLKRVAPNELVRSTMTLMERLVGDEVRLETRLAPGLPRIHVDPFEIERALVNLVVNARDVMPGGGAVCIVTRSEETPEGRAVTIAVEDAGPGIDEADRPHLFEPFFTTRAHAGGTGLGLATVLGTAEQHGGTVRVEARPGGGSIFTLVLPARDSTSADAVADGEPVGPRHGTRRLELLVVDDEPSVADVTRRILEASGHRVHVANQPREALRVWAQRAAAIDLVICDVAMAEMWGPELVRRMGEAGPSPRVLFMTGYSEEAVRAELGHPVLAKPFTAAELLRAIDEATR